MNRNDEDAILDSAECPTSGGELTKDSQNTNKDLHIMVNKLSSMLKEDEDVADVFDTQRSQGLIDQCTQEAKKNQKKFRA